MNEANARSVKHVRRKSFIRRVFIRIRKLFSQLLLSSLTRRIVFLNLAALCALVACIMYLNQFHFREGLIDTKIESLKLQGKMIAGVVAASATVDTNSLLINPERLMELQAGQSVTPKLESTDNWDFPINPERVAPLLPYLISPATTRARIYDRDANLLLDSLVLYSSGQVLSYNLPPIVDDQPSRFERFKNWIVNFFHGDNVPEDQPAGPGIVYREVLKAMDGEIATEQRRNKQGELIVSVAVPVQRYHTVVGVLLLSTIGSDIDQMVQAERIEILKVSAIIALVILALSLFLAYTIANPLRRLSAAADRVRHGTNQREEIPDFSDRQDEVGHLSTSIRDMTSALYGRIEAIERFAADVSHELKNPLTSLRSAVETLPLARNDESRERLMDIIQHDVRRLDRLITDISDASRLDAELAREVTDTVDMEFLLNNIVRAAREVRRNAKVAAIRLHIAPLSGNRRYLVAGHDLRLGQVLSNLIENARSFIPNEHGEIRIHMSMKQQIIHIVVEDNGPGIRAEKIERIFERFYTDRPGAESFGQNSGLGLSISRQIIEAHNGTLDAENIESPDHPEEWLGARFIIELPAAGKGK